MNSFTKVGLGLVVTALLSAGALSASGERGTCICSKNNCLIKNVDKDADCTIICKDDSAHGPMVGSWTYRGAPETECTEWEEVEEFPIALTVNTQVLKNKDSLTKTITVVPSEPFIIQLPIMTGMVDTFVKDTWKSEIYGQIMNLGAPLRVEPQSLSGGGTEKHFFYTTKGKAQIIFTKGDKKIVVNIKAEKPVIDSQASALKSQKGFGFNKPS